MPMIEHSSNIPYYVQLTTVIRDKIRRQEWRAGSKIPGEMELCLQAGVSRTVVRQALRELDYAGLIVRRKGKGTFVAEPKINESLIQKLTGSYQDMAERGLRSSSRVLHHRVVTATEKVAGYLNLRLGAQVVDIYRLRFVEDTPIQLANTFVPLALCPGLADVDLTNRSLYEFLEKECGRWISRGRRYIEAVAASDVQAKLLGIPRGAPLVALDSISYLEDGTPIEYYHAVHRGDRSRFEVELRRTRAQGLGATAQAVDIDQLPPSDPNVKLKPRE
jgi:GntR family transcriptional regulator